MILITGGAGFVGRHLCSYLAVRGADRVRVLSRNPVRVFEAASHTLGVALRTTERLAADGLVDANDLDEARRRAARGAALLNEVIEPVPADVADVRSLEGAIDGVDVVVHTVAIIRETEDGTFAKTNVLGTENVVAAMRGAGVRRLVAMGVLGANDDERLPYSRSRWQAEMAVATSGLDYTIVKPSLVLGHGDTFSRRLVRALDFSKPLVALPNGGRTRFQPLWIGDLVRALATCLEEHKTIGASYEIGGPEPVSLAELQRRFARALGKRRVFLPVPSSLLVPGAVVMGRVFRDPPVTPTELRELDHDNVTDEDAVERAFGFAPLALEDYLDEYVLAMTK